MHTHTHTHAHTHTHTQTHTHFYITEALRLVTYVQLFYMTVTVKVTACTTLVCYYRVGFYNVKATPTNDTDYSYHIKAVELI